VNVYIDSSVLLRVVLGEPGRLRSWRTITRAMSSELLRVECLRTLDRARLVEGLDDDEVAETRAAILEHIQAFDVIRIDGRILERAAEAFPTALGSLDAIHLASALLARRDVPDLALATHDAQLARAARAEGFRVLGATDAR
jgi:predicted nucleic acid-binding protein